MQNNRLAHQIQTARDQHFKKLPKNHPYYTIKQQAWRYFEQIGLPSPKNEAYKYTPITAKLTDNFDLSQPTIHSPFSLHTLETHLPFGLEAYQLVLINGKLNKTYSNWGYSDQSFEVLSFTEAYHQQHPSFLNYLRQDKTTRYEPLALLNTILFEEGLFIHIGDRVILDQPIWIYHITDSREEKGISYPRVLITAGQDSQASIVNSWHSIGGHPSFTNSVTDIYLSSNAQLYYYNLQIQDLHQAYQSNATFCYQESSSVLKHYNFTWDGLFIRNNPHFTIQASRSETDIYGLYCLDQQQHTDNHTTVDHQQPYTHSNELYKGIIAGEATGVFNGRIYVQAPAQKTVAFQANHNLLVSHQATLHTKPQLEIWADDVKCSHGATIGQLDEAQLFYLQARGIPINQARYMLMYAFANEVIDKVMLKNLQEYLYTTLNKKLAQWEVINLI